MPIASSVSRNVAKSSEPRRRDATNKTAVCFLDHRIGRSKTISQRSFERLLNGFCIGRTQPSGAPRILVQAVRDQPSRAFEKLEIFVAERVQFVALGIEHT